MKRDNWTVSALGTTALVTLLTACGSESSPAEKAADTAGAINPTLILHNGKIVTQDPDKPVVTALAVFGDQVLATGSDAELLSEKGASTCVFDLGGRTVTPGFADGHIHSKINRIDERTVDLTPVRSIEDIKTALAARAQTTEPGELITTTSDWHEAQLTELRLPNRWDLDEVSREHPIVVVRGGHHYILNTAALEKWNIDADTVSPPGGQIVVDETRGEINGELVDRARDLVPLPPVPERTRAERAALLAEEHALYNSLGLTSIRNPGASLEDMYDYIALQKSGDMTIRASVLIRWDRKTPADEYRKVLETWPVKSGFGDEWLRVDGIKLGVDGGYEGGWMTEPYKENFGREGEYYGLNTVPREIFIDIVKLMNELDLRPSTHAVGDAAVDLVLDAYAAADAEDSIRDKRWAIEHAFITRPDQIERIRDLGVIVSAQSHLYLAGASLVKFWGEERAAATAPVRSWLDAGVRVAGGTDNKLPYRPESPIMTFYHWVSRDTVSAGVLGAEEAITREEALRIATIENAYLTFEEDIKGTLEPGKLADLVVLSQDIMEVPIEDIPDTKVLGTMVGGRFVYETSELGYSCEH